MNARGPAVSRGQRLAGRFTPPGDKSITHRAVLFGLLAAGETVIHGPNAGEDCANSLAAAGALGARVGRGSGTWTLRGAGGSLRAPDATIDCGNSGTAMRLLAGIAAGQPFATGLAGDASLSRRPMARIVAPLRAMGARIETAPGERPPLRITGGSLTGRAHVLEIPSAQVATSVLLAGLRASGVTSVEIPGPARDHTERMLPAFGVGLEIETRANGGRRVAVRGGASLRAAAVQVAGDFSAAAFLFVAAACEPGASVTATGVSLNPTRTGLLDVLEAMGADVRIERAHEAAGEPVGDVTVTGPESLRPFDVPAAWVPRLVDEVPAWAVLASAARGTSRLCDAAELRVKESDRLAAMARGLGGCGIAVRERSDGLEVTGGQAHGARIAAELDHRIVMAFAALGARTPDPMRFDDVATVATSFPGFFRVLASLGASVEDAA
ncbi:MAG TPA: 3-phosphoshikimate 1-carboxyvinyltransferase [Polyangiaceae bacterium]|nr:3-phosphoshikimate 1-carboxyvinyltransferase [Polyangiaceae bacterium]